MSRIGVVPIEIPKDVTAQYHQGTVTVRGPKGTLTVSILPQLDIKIADNKILVEAKKNDSFSKSLHGLIRTNIANVVVGVTKGWERSLELVGVGYRASGSGKQITLSVGFSHPVVFSAGADINFTITDNTKVIVWGIDKKLVGETAARIRAIRPPEPYKGKGIRYFGEVVRKKAGKAVKAAGAAA